MQQTPLHDEHVALAARMVDFAGWSMPIQYPTGIPQEHLAVREDVGIFDVSHMGEIRVSGPGAATFLAWATLNDPRKLKPGMAQYSLLANGSGGLTDDLYIYRDADEDFLIVANASNVAAVHAQLGALAQQHGFGGAVHDESHAWALIAVQGPTAASRLDRWTDAELSEVKKNRFVDTRLSGIPVRMARTGYTGEDGFEVFCRPSDAVVLWRILVDSGMTPCGLGARDTLRLEAGFPLFGHEFDAHSNPLCTPFAWVVKDKDAFGVAGFRSTACGRQLVGIKVDGRGIPREGYRVLADDGALLGQVTSGTMSPLTRQSIALAWVRSDYASEGTRVNIEVRGQPVPATVARTPFFSA
jgi:aminomethyltransferase